MKKLSIILLSLVSAACSSAQNGDHTATHHTVASGQTESAIFAGGCFWCVESDFEKLPGVISAVSGYTGGETTNPDYQQVSYSETGHYEAVNVLYDPQQVSYNELLDYFWLHIDPTDPNGQFCDKGSSYRTAIFAKPEQIAQARSSKTNLENTKPFKANIVTPVLPAQTFYNAEDYHQDYYKKHPIKYKGYRTGCGRDRRLNQLWGKKS